MPEKQTTSGLNLDFRPIFHFEESIDKPPIGFSLDIVRTSRDGQEIRVLQRGFLTDYQGEIFFSIMDSISGVFLRKWLSTNRLDESIIRNCIIFLNNNNISNIYINIPAKMMVIARERIKFNSEVTKENIADISRIEFPGVAFKQDCRIIYIFNHGWRRGLYFDLSPIQDKDKQIKGDLETLFASFHSYLIFHEVFDLSPEIKEKLMEYGWFPFIRILGNNFQKIRDAVVYNFPIKDISLEVIATFSNDFINEMVNNWMKKDVFKQLGLTQLSL